LADIVVGIGIPEGLLDGMKEVLAVKENDGSLDCGFNRHSVTKKNNPARGPASGTDQAGSKYSSGTYTA
jgi:hypothetical protein